MERQKGYSLLEILIVIGLLLLFAAGSVSLYTEILPTTDLDESMFTLKQQIRKARQLSVGGYNNSNHGVYIDPANRRLINYQGDSYQLRDPAFDIETAFTASAVLSDTLFEHDLNFVKWTGLPNQPGSIYMGMAGHTATATVNSLGIVNSN